MTMEGSSDTARRKSANSRRLDASLSSERNLRLLEASRLSLSTDASRNSVFGTERRLRDPPSDHFRNALGASGISEGGVALDSLARLVEWGDVSLRQWLDNAERTIDAIESLHIFRQIVEIVNAAHSQGVVLSNIRPSCFVISSFNHVSFIESASCSDSGSDDGLNTQTMEIKQLISEVSSSNPESALETHLALAGRKTGFETNDSGNSENTGGKQSFPVKELLLVESSWYTSPEEIAGASCSCASDIYRLGVLLFELFCTFHSTEEKNRTMSSLRHRVLPRQLLVKWPKEASFCLWSLHPDPCSRPKIGELLQSEFLNECRDGINEREAVIELTQKIEEHELLLEFLVLARQGKQETADKLHDTVSFLSSDVEEIVSKQKGLKEKGGSPSEVDKVRQTIPNHAEVNRFEDEAEDGVDVRNDDMQNESCKSEMILENQGSLLLNSSRLMKHFKKLESTYLFARQRPDRGSGKLVGGHSQPSSNSRGSVVQTEKSGSVSLSKEYKTNSGESGWISPFLEGLCKYLSYTQLTVKAHLKQGDLLNSSNLVCSINFDRDGQYFATAGVNKKIKVFDCDAILNGDRDIHYPAVEMVSRSKLSSVCWNSYIKSQIASSNFEGVVQVWDAARCQMLLELREHEKRVWSVDYSSADPTVLASGSDDGSVKLWSINQGASIGTIRTKANICCVQFPMGSGRSIAFGSADHRIYYYDLRNPRVPLFTLVGHNKTVSYVKFVDSTTLISSSTDNTLKLWDLSLCTSRVVDCPLQSFTGHANVKNFVGLSVSDGYIATGSETNEVFIYHKAFPMPALSFRFNSVDPVSGNETDDTSQFISSVCWRRQSSILVAANSTGDIKLLEMV